MHVLWICAQWPCGTSGGMAALLRGMGRGRTKLEFSAVAIGQTSSWSGLKPGVAPDKDSFSSIFLPWPRDKFRIDCYASN